MSNAIAVRPLEHFKQTLTEQSAKIALALPQHVDASRFMQMAINAVAVNPYLLECDRPSLYMAIMNAAETGLEPDPKLGHVWFVPRKGKVQCQIGYRGYAALAYRSGMVESITAELVREGDRFEFELGTEGFIRHTPAFNKGAQVTHVWARALLKGGKSEFTVMSAAEVYAIRDRFSDSAKSGKFSPWSDPIAAESMMRKCPVRRLCKLLPVSTEMQRAITIDEAAEILEAPDTKGAPDALKSALPEVKASDDLNLEFHGEIPEDGQ